MPTAAAAALAVASAAVANADGKQADAAAAAVSSARSQSGRAAPDRVDAAAAATQATAQALASSGASANSSVYPEPAADLQQSHSLDEDLDSEDGDLEEGLRAAFGASELEPLQAGWPRAVRWPDIDAAGARPGEGRLLSLRLSQDLHWQASALKSSEVEVRRRSRRADAAWASAGPPANPDGCGIDPEEELAASPATSSGAEAASRRRIRLAAEWRSPPLLELPQDVPRWDPAEYRGSELSVRREAWRLQLERAHSGGGGAPGPGLGVVAPHGLCSGSSAPSLGTVAAAAPGLMVTAAAKDLHGSVEYRAKLVSLMSQLENHAAQPDALVQNFWASLLMGERARFAAEFPQFLPFLPMAEATMARSALLAQQPSLQRAS